MPPPQGETAPRPPGSVDAWLQYLSLEEKVGQLFWFGLQGASVSPEAQELVRQGKAGGFIYFARQGNSLPALRSFSDQLQQLARGRDRFTPGLFISVDHEGGKVQRFTDGFAPWPGAMAIGATRSESYAEQVAAAMARELRLAGVNVNLAPVADVNNNPENPVIGARSFGEDPQMVARLVEASVRGFRSERMGSVAKHFPGHGDTHLDSHKALPTVKHSLDRLATVELVPFRAAIKAGVDAIMTAHVLFPSLAANDMPATLSPAVLQELLKEKLSFQGMVVTDAMDTMKAITDHYGLEKGLVLALQGGADTVLITESYGRHDQLYGLVLKAVQEGRVPKERVNDAVRRVLTTKARLGLLPGLPEPRIASPEGGTTEEHRKLALRIGAEALTLVRNKHLPLRLPEGQMVLAVGPAYGGKVTGHDGVFTALGAGLKARHGNTQEITLDRRPSPGSVAAVRAMAGKAAVIVYGVANAQSYPEHQALITELIATGKPVIVVGMGEPYELTSLPHIETYLAAYGFQEANLTGVGAVLFGHAPAKGRLPVSVPGLYPLGHGLSL